MSTNGAMSGSSRITISWRQLTFFVVYAMVLIGAGAYLATSTRYQVVGVLMIVCALAVLVSRVARGAGKAPCPSCGHVLDDLQRSHNSSVLCDGCGRFFHGENGVITAVPLDAVAATPLFPTQMPATFVWPEGCPVCAAPTVREVEAKLLQVEAARSLAASAVNPVANVLATRSTQVKVPHCAAHDDGVKLQGEISGGSANLVFRSYAFQRRFCEANHVKPAHLIHAGRSSGPLARLVPRG
jgi:hypothetical protein